MKNKFIDLILNGDENNESAMDIDFSFITRDSIEEGESYPSLFRYCQADYNNIRALETSQLYLSPISELNDVFEGLSSISNLNGKQNNKKLAYIKSFSENSNNLLMWGLYADSFKGMCIEYDVNRLKGTAQEHLLYHLFPVAYTKKRNSNYSIKSIHEENIAFMKGIDSKEDVDSLVYIRNILPLFLIKSSEWQYENEWRIIATAEHLFYEDWYEDGDPECLQKLYEIGLEDEHFIKFNCIKRVYLGPRMEEQKKKHIREIGKATGIQVIEMKLSDNEYKLIPKE